MLHTSKQYDNNYVVKRISYGDDFLEYQVLWS
jgi:hypothetical protein